MHAINAERATARFFGVAAAAAAGENDPPFSSWTVGRPVTAAVAVAVGAPSIFSVPAPSPTRRPRKQHTKKREGNPFIVIGHHSPS